MRLTLAVFTLITLSGCWYEYGDGRTRGPFLPGQGLEPCDVSGDASQCMSGQVCHRLYGDVGQYPTAGVCGSPCTDNSQCQSEESDPTYGSFASHVCTPVAVGRRCVGPENPGHPDYVETPLDGGPGPEPDAGVDAGVDAGPQPDGVIETFEPSSLSVLQGDQVTFEIAVSNVTSCNLPGFGEVDLAGDLSAVGPVTINENTTFQLTCVGLSGNDVESDPRTVTIGNTVFIASFDASAGAVASGSQVTLSYSVRDADSCELSTNGGTPSPLTFEGTTGQGSTDVTITESSTFDLTCYGLGEPSTAGVTVNMAEILSWAVPAPVVEVGENFDATWSAPHTSSCSIMEGDVVVATVDNDAADTGAASFAADEAAARTVHLACTIDGGNEVITSGPLELFSIEILSFDILEAQPVAVDSNVRFQWESSFADECAIFGPSNPSTPLSAGLDPSCSGSDCGEVSVSDAGDYRLVCTKEVSNYTGQTSAVFQVALQAEITSYDITLTGGPGGDDVELSWDSIGTESCTLLGMQAPAGVLTLSDPGVGAGVTDYVLECSGLGVGNTATRTITVWWGPYNDASVGEAVDAVVGDVNISLSGTILTADVFAIKEVSGNFRILDTNSGVNGAVETRYIGGSLTIAGNSNFPCATCDDYCGVVEGSFTCSSNQGGCSATCP